MKAWNLLISICNDRDTCTDCPVKDKCSIKVPYFSGCETFTKEEIDD